MNNDLNGLRVLVGEDEWLVAVYLEDILRKAGCEIVGPVGSVAEALAMVERDGFDVAVLDVNFRGEIVWPVVDTLIDHGVPVVLVTGYERAELQHCYRQLPHCQKPYSARTILATLRQAASRMAGLPASSPGGTSAS